MSDIEFHPIAKVFPMLDDVPLSYRFSNWQAMPNGCSSGRNRAKNAASAISYYRTAPGRAARWSPLSANPLTCLQKP